eukprot:2789612-Heterocapsa_arctica.AAC.1
MTYSPASWTSLEEPFSVESSSPTSAVSVESSSSMQNTDNYSPTSSLGEVVEDPDAPEAAFWTEASTATVAADEEFERHGQYFVAMHRAYHLLGLLMILRARDGASREELMEINLMRMGAGCEARSALTLVRAAALQSGRRQ